MPSVYVKYVQFMDNTKKGRINLAITFKKATFACDKKPCSIWKRFCKKFTPHHGIVF